jgi:hypothetical protein
MSKLVFLSNLYFNHILKCTSQVLGLTGPLLDESRPTARVGWPFFCPQDYALSLTLLVPLKTTLEAVSTAASVQVCWPP